MGFSITGRARFPLLTFNVPTSGKYDYTLLSSGNSFKGAFSLVAQPGSVGTQFLMSLKISSVFLSDGGGTGTPCQIQFDLTANKGVSPSLLKLFHNVL